MPKSTKAARSQARDTDSGPSKVEQWWIFDPSGTAVPMGIVRLGTRRYAAAADAHTHAHTHAHAHAHAAFCRIFGWASMAPMNMGDGSLASRCPPIRDLIDIRIPV
jgi:hypothetical protein